LPCELLHTHRTIPLTERYSMDGYADPDLDHWRQIGVNRADNQTAALTGDIFPGRVTDRAH
jgi:hypothetical protein